jgi:hypothetical protein
LNCLHFAGWCSTTLSTNIGLWMIHPSREYFSSGPKHPEIVGQIDMINCTFKAVHFGFGSDLNFTNGETWSRVCGPLFFYCNQVPSGTANPQIPLYADAAAQPPPRRARGPILVHRRHQLRAGFGPGHGHGPAGHQRQRQSECLRRRNVGGRGTATAFITQSAHH